jgi:hypothetical protein
LKGKVSDPDKEKRILEAQIAYKSINWCAKKKALLQT